MFAVLLVAGFLGSLIEVSLLAFVGSLVDMMRAAADARGLPRQSLGHPAVDGLRRPGRAARRLDRRTTSSRTRSSPAPVANRVRWQTHRYVLRQSLGFFQNDFAGRVANKVMQTGAGAARIRSCR